MFPSPEGSLSRVPDDIREFVELLYEQVKKIVERNEPVDPALLFHLSTPVDGRCIAVVPVHDMVNSIAGKCAIRALMEKVVGEDGANVDIAVFISEAWAATMDADQVTEHEANNMRVKDRPDKKEIVMFSVLTKDRQYLAACDILTEPVRTIGAMDIADADEGEARGNLVSERVPPVRH